MAYVNVKDWSVDQVTDWLKGLDNVILQYTSSFLNNGVTGHQLLNLRADDLEHLGVLTLGHQEIILEAVEHLRHFHFELDKENLQMLALRLSCAANSLYKELLLENDSCSVIQKQTMADVHNIIMTVKPLACWLDRSPFAGDTDYNDSKTQLLELGFEMATSAHRGIFSENPVRTIRKICEKLVKIADHIIQEVTDPMILQPASLDLATLKKKEQELGFFILPNNHAIHQIAEIKYGSPAHGCTKIEDGDEIVQVNYQTVVGWQRKKVMMLLQESPPEIVLTLKKRPRHTKVYGQIYMKPYRLPSRKRGQPYSRWNDNLPSPRLLPLLDLPPMSIPKSTVETPDEIEIEELSSSDSEPPDSPLDGSVRMYPLKPRPLLQRRNTITGTTPTDKRPHLSIAQYWQLMNYQENSTHSSSCNIGNPRFEEDPRFLRDKSASCSLGLEKTTRPTTVIGLSQNRGTKKTPSFKNDDNNKALNKKRVNFDDKPEDIESSSKEPAANQNRLSLEPSNLDEEKSVSVNSLASLTNENIAFIDEGRDLTDRTSMVTDWKKEIVNELIDKIKMKPNDSVVPPTIPEVPNIQPDEEPPAQAVNPIIKDAVLSEVNIHNIIKKFDSQNQQDSPRPLPAKPKVFPRQQLKKPPEVPQKPESAKRSAIPPQVPPRSATTKLRGRLDKSHSTPAYDTTEDDPTIEKFSVEKIQAEVPVPPEKPADTASTETRKISDPFSETKYELGIPLLESVENVPAKLAMSSSSSSLSSCSKSEQSKTEQSKTEQVKAEQPDNDVPPKPPPRNMGVDLPKPAYPSDSPKPPNLVELTKSALSESPAPSRQIFQFPDSKSSGDVRKISEDLGKPPTQSDFPKASAHLPPKPDFYRIENLEHAAEGTYGKGVDVFPMIQGSSEESLRTPKYFEPKTVSTPVRTKDSDSEVTVYKSPNYEMQKSTSESKISPTNSIVRAMIYSNKNKSGRKKNNLMSKRRKVTVNELSPADIQGYLYQRLRNKHTQTVEWQRRWFILFGSCLYGFKTKEDPKASFLIFLSGFTVAVATEVNSRSNAFKVYHTGTAFYFSADDSETLHSWIEMITAATLHNDSSKISEGALYSGTDDSDSEKPKSTTTPAEKSTESLRKCGSLKKFTSKKTSESAPSGSTSLDRKWFFNKSSSHNSKNSLPVPTAQFRSYRKIRPNEESTSVTTGNFTSHVPSFAPRSEIKKLSSQNVSVPNLTVELVDPDQESAQAGGKMSKPKPLDYVHASNPSLCNTTEFNLPPVTIKKTHKQHNDSLAGFVTLEELMNRQAEERRMNPHFDVGSINFSLIKPDVVYGEVPIRTKDRPEKEEKPETSHGHKKGHSRNGSDSQKSTGKAETNSSSCFGKRLGSLKKSHKEEEDFNGKTATYPKVARGFDNKLNRSLPRTHKLQESDCSDLSSMQDIYMDDPAASSFKKHSYEMIYCPQTVTDVQFAQNRTLDDRMYNDTPKKSHKLKKQHSFNSHDKKSSKSSGGQHGKVVDSSSGRVKLKSATQYTPMSLPLSQDPKVKPKFAFELNLDEKSSKHSGGRLKQIFGKQAEPKKEKTFLGSPKLHRAIFKRHNSGSDISWPPATVISPPIIITEASYTLDTSTSTSSGSEPMSLGFGSHLDYSGLEYPPVFEPESYSWGDPHGGSGILRKQSKQTSEKKQ